jgi:2'-5' RNA ligase
VSARLFVAVELTDDVRARISEAITTLRASLRRSGLDDAFRWVAHENLHVTLRFLGDIPDDDVPRMMAAFGDGVDERQGVVALEGLGTFPPKGRPRILHTPVAGGVPLLRGVRDRADALLAPICTWEPETRPFSPHLTLARARDRAAFAPAALRGMLDAAEWPRVDLAVTHATLFRSVTHSSGPQYSVLARAALRSA